MEAQALPEATRLRVACVLLRARQWQPRLIHRRGRGRGLSTCLPMRSLWSMETA